MGCTLAPPGEWDRTICARRRCDLMFKLLWPLVSVLLCRLHEIPADSGRLSSHGPTNRNRTVLSRCRWRRELIISNSSSVIWSRVNVTASALASRNRLQFFFNFRFTTLLVVENNVTKAIKQPPVNRRKLKKSWSLFLGGWCYCPSGQVFTSRQSSLMSRRDINICFFF